MTTSARPLQPGSTHGETRSASGHGATHPRLPHEDDESSHSQASATPDHQVVGQKAFANATDGSVDTDRGAEADKVYNEHLAPDRGTKPPRK